MKRYFIKAFRAFFTVYIFAICQPVWADNCQEAIKRLTHPVVESSYKGELFDYKKEIVRRMYRNLVKLFGHRKTGLSSNMLTKEAVFLNPQAQTGTQVLYFGSGADVLRPLIDYPRATEFHFFDSMTGWGGGKTIVVHEIIRRLQAVSSKVRVSKEGFMSRFSEETTPAEFLGVMGGVIMESRVDSMTIEIVIESQQLGSRAVNFHLHPVNFNHSNIVKRVLSENNVWDIEGVLMMGVEGFIKPDLIENIGQRMTQSGTIVSDSGYAWMWYNSEHGMSLGYKMISLEKTVTNPFELPNLDFMHGDRRSDWLEGINDKFSQNIYIFLPNFY